ncbi:Metabotropic glutamate receptor 7 [Stylophora pistillata]|uniref:Metabotropic glutamate receptor 7 n=1 Tax=Stylophora pistillata TaxID=50429 RepID=A0A2B4SVB2_STYPI|nr:Metabotropic glutamate receptor 7 [Stylophora pistillata]
MLRLRIASLLFILSVIVPIHQTDTKFNQNRIFKPADVTLGGLFDVHFNGPNDNCGGLFAMGLGHVEAMLFAIERINNDSNILPNVTIGYDIRDYCENAGIAMRMAYDLVQNTDAFSRADKNRTLDEHSSPPQPVNALIGPYDSESAVLVGSLLQVHGIAAISPSATSHELSSKMYQDFFRTIPCDTWQAKVMADIIEYFKWTYVAAFAIDDSYGRQGIWAVKKEVYRRRTFCIAFSEFIPRLSYQEKLVQIVFKLKKQRNIGVVLVWLSGGYARAFLHETNKQGVRDRTWIFSDAMTAEERVHLDPRFAGLDGSLGIQPQDFRHLPFDEHLKHLTRNATLRANSPWWDEFWIQICNKTLSACKDTISSHRFIKKIRSSFVPYLLDAVYAVAHALDNIYKCVEPNGLLPEGKCPGVTPDNVTKSLPIYLKNVSFQGATGRVQFNHFGDRIVASYDIVNFQRNNRRKKKYEKVLVGSWMKDKNPQLALESNVVWNTLINQRAPRSICAEDCSPGTRQSLTTPCCWKCIRCPLGSISTSHNSRNCTECSQTQQSNEKRSRCVDLPILSMHMNSVTGVIVALLSSVGLVLALLTWGILAKYFNTPVVKAANREMSLILLAGITYLFVIPLLNLSDSTDTICCFSHCGRITIWIMCVSALLVKTMHIVSAFRGNTVARNVKPLVSKASTQRALLAILTAVQTGLTVAWLVSGPPYKKITITHLQHISAMCKPYSNLAGKNILLANITYGVLLWLVCAYYAFRPRQNTVFVSRAQVADYTFTTAKYSGAVSNR